ncbi:uncharacterized protein KD926_003358 [Aspergillus affinis]|uniref:uncharacterized protein n=1 Tax=Aspergillus affinis TaxID=1070780 RepID=UPI0022FDFAAE|nr:uncharacterized protein KD926_003358 [Aspergillus affinis]KAI9043588.1 hypothetical protein KD926_003358 [Aspergillus affinis]
MASQDIKAQLRSSVKNPPSSIVSRDGVAQRTEISQIMSEFRSEIAALHDEVKTMRSEIATLREDVKTSQKHQDRSRINFELNGGKSMRQFRNLIVQLAGWTVPPTSTPASIAPVSTSTAPPSSSGNPIPVPTVVAPTSIRTPADVPPPVIPNSAAISASSAVPASTPRNRSRTRSRRRSSPSGYRYTSPRGSSRRRLPESYGDHESRRRSGRPSADELGRGSDRDRYDSEDGAVYYNPWSLRESRNDQRSFRPHAECRPPRHSTESDVNHYYYWE